MRLPDPPIGTAFAHPARTRIAYLFGSDRQSGIVRRGGGDVWSDGNTDLWRLRTDPDDFVRLHIPANFGRAAAKPGLGTVALVLNLVTDPDVNPHVLQIAGRFLKRFPGKVINPPEAVLATSRDRVQRRLSGIEGLLAPRVARFRDRTGPAMAAIDRAGLSFPAILRIAGTHNGDIVGLVPERDALAPLLQPGHQYLLTEFVDVRAGGGGLYHKIRIFFFDEVPVVRHLLVSDHWNVHGPDRERVMIHHPEWIARERALIADGIDGLPPPARSALREIRARMPLDYFGVDFALLPDGRAVLFEANATMNFFPLSTEARFDYAAAPVAAAGRAAFDRMLARRMGG